MKTIVRSVLVCLVAAAYQTPVQAHGNDLALAYLFGYSGNATAGLRSFGPQPPYFALHPPVYYGERYTRPYGASPFAAWPQLQSSPTYAPQPHVHRAHSVWNPCCTIGQTISGSGSQGEIVQSTVAAPLEFENPYYQPPQQFTATQK